MDLKNGFKKMVIKWLFMLITVCKVYEKNGFKKIVIRWFFILIINKFFKIYCN